MMIGVKALSAKENGEKKERKKDKWKERNRKEGKEKERIGRKEKRKKEKTSTAGVHQMRLLHRHSLYH